MSTDMRRGLMAAAAAASVALGLAGCATGEDTASPPRGGTHADPLRSYIDAARPLAEAEMDRYSDIYSDFSVEAEGSRTLVYRYTFRTHVDPAQARKGIASMDDTIEAMAENNIFPEMRAAGVDDPAAKWIYRNSDGTVITTVELND